MPRPIARLLEPAPFPRFSVVVPTFCFWGAGPAKLADFPAAVAQTAFIGLHPAAPIAALVIATQIGGSLLMITGIEPWLGAGALGVFTALTIPLAHPFRSVEGEAAIAHFRTATEHVTVIGGLMVAAILAHRLRAGCSPSADAELAALTRYGHIRDVQHAGTRKGALLAGRPSMSEVRRQAPLNCPGSF